MEQINNEQTVRECSNVLGHQVENIPQLDTSKIVLTAEVNPKMLRRSVLISVNPRTSSGTHTIFTTEATRNFYLTGFIAGYCKDATCDSATGSYQLSCVIDGKTQFLHSFPIITLSAQSSEIAINLSQPLKLDRSTSVAMSGTFTAGLCVRAVEIYGYYE